MPVVGAAHGEVNNCPQPGVGQWHTDIEHKEYLYLSFPSKGNAEDISYHYFNSYFLFCHLIICKLACSHTLEQNYTLSTFFNKGIQ